MRWLCSLTRIFLSSVVSAKMSVFIFKDGRNIRIGIFSRFLGVPKLRSVNCSKSMKNWRGEFYYTKKKAKAPLQQKTLKMFLGGNGAVCSAFLCTQRIYSIDGASPPKFLDSQDTKEKILILRRWRNTMLSKRVYLSRMLECETFRVVVVTKWKLILEQLLGFETEESISSSSVWKTTRKPCWEWLRGMSAHRHHLALP